MAVTLHNINKAVAIIHNMSRMVNKGSNYQDK